VERIGVRYISSQETPPDQLPSILGGIDVIYEAVGASGFAFDVMRHLGTNGVFIFTGVPGRRGPIEVDTDLLMRNLVLKNQIVYGTVNAGRAAFETAVRDLAMFHGRWPEAVKGLITGRFPVEAYRDLLLNKDDGIKNVLVFGP
jgi:threonine dehydrogenase-like Zn-dependent dehydrogenase